MRTLFASFVRYKKFSGLTSMYTTPLLWHWEIIWRIERATRAAEDSVKSLAVILS